MTTGEYLVANSTLTSGTALQHLLALQIGSGQGTVFCSQFNVRIERQELTVTRKAKRRVQAAPVEVAPRQIEGKKDISVLYRVPSMTVFAESPEEITVLQRIARSTVVHKLGTVTDTRKRRVSTAK